MEIELPTNEPGYRDRISLVWRITRDTKVRVGEEIPRLNCLLAPTPNSERLFMRYLARSATGLAFLFLGSQPASAQTRCRAADTNSAHFLRVINMMMSPEHAASRTAYSLPLVASAQIALVSDSTVCARAGQAMDAFARTVDSTSRPPSTLPLFVFQIGTSYAVVDLLSPNDEDADFIYFFGSSWNFTGTAFSQ